MAIALEHFNFIVRRSTIEDKYPGGWDQCLIDHASSLGLEFGMTNISLEMAP